MNSTQDHEHFEQLAVGYALSALEPDDEQLIREHLPTCSSCSQLVDDTSEIALGLAPAPEPPSAALRARVLGQALADPTQSGAPEPVAPSAPSAPTSMPAMPTPTPAHLPTQRRVLRSVRALAGAAAALVLVLAVAGGALLGRGTAPGSPAAPLASAPTELVDALVRNAPQVELHGSGAGSARALLDGDRVVLVASGLPANDTRSTTYVLWAADSAFRMRPVATFDVSGSAPVVVEHTGTPVDLTTRRILAISLERGRLAPSTPSSPVLVSPST